MNYLFIIKSEQDPSTRYRVWPLQDKLENMGHITRVVESHSPLSRLIAESKWCDTLIIQRKLFTRPVVWLLRRFSGNLIFDLDDAIFLRSNGQPSSSRMWRFRYLAARCNQIWAGNRYLAAQAGKFCSKVHFVPTPVDTIGYGIDVVKDEVFTLVWIGSSSTRKYLESCRHVLEEIGRLDFPVRLKVISDFEFTLENMEVVNHSWSQASEVSELKSCHVGIAPMLDNAWTRGKCALKVLQYMASSLPVISSNVGANAEIISSENGFLADNTEDWINAVRFLANNQEAAISMGEAGKLFVEENYSNRVVVSRLISCLEADQTLME